ncbi:hypothetical protein HYS97_03450 [Candidatus Daviesbacteria bacterium]|nr:hypothetical protein [Candidatus Daviesbacteria bacterium]
MAKDISQKGNLLKDAPEEAKNKEGQGLESGNIPIEDEKYYSQISGLDGAENQNQLEGSFREEESEGDDVQGA